MTAYAAVTPLLAVGGHTHKWSEMLAQALVSAWAENFTDWESRVRERGHAPAYPRRRPRPSSRYYDLREGKASAARNIGFAGVCAKGERTPYLNDDYLWLPAKLQRQVIEAGRIGADMIACDYIELRPDGGGTSCRVPGQHAAIW
jgi:hypothetical protein